MSRSQKKIFSTTKSRHLHNLLSLFLNLSRFTLKRDIFSGTIFLAIFRSYNIDARLSRQIAVVIDFT